MGSCVPPKGCPGTGAQYDAWLKSTDSSAAILEISQIDPLWLNNDSATVDLPLQYFEDLASAYWTQTATQFEKGTSTEEDTRIFMLERRIVGSLKVKIATAAPQALKVELGDEEVFSAPIPDPSSRFLINNPLTEAEQQVAHDQIDHFAFYLYRAVSAELGQDPKRIDGIITLLGICLEGVGNAVYDGKALTKFPRPPHPRALPTPQISTWPGGHAYFCGVMAAVLHVVLTKGKLTSADLSYRQSLAWRLAKMAQQISGNRERARLHFREDSATGLKMGFKVMKAVLLAAKAEAANPTNVAGALSDLHALILEVA